MRKSEPDEGRLYVVYLMEAARLVEQIRTGIDRLEEYWKKHMKIYKQTTHKALVVDALVQKDLQTVIADIARLYNLLTYEPSSKTCPYREISKERTKYFRDLFASVRMNAIGSRAARNSLEHFEERVDKEIQEQRQAQPNAPGFVYGCIFPNEAMLRLVASERTRIRTFAFEEMHYFNFEGDISLRQVRQEAEAIRSVLIRCLGRDGYDAAGQSGLFHPPLPPGALSPASGRDGAS
jgi:hypothetical protein